jgi:hypothetical protein
VQDIVQPALSAWESYYVIMGSSGAALTGLQFVVIALGAETRRTTGGAIDAYATPTVVHFCSALFVAAVLSAPWQALWKAALALGACGLFGVCYAIIVMRRALAETAYRPVMEDWVWHIALPLVAYATLLGSAPALVTHTVTALFPIGAAVLFLLFIGIHNAWDAVTFLSVAKLSDDQAAETAGGEASAG